MTLLSDVVAVIGISVSVASVVGSATWIISAFRRDGALLRQSVVHLTESVKELKQALQHLDRQLDEHDRRVLIIENKLHKP